MKTQSVKIRAYVSPDMSPGKRRRKMQDARLICLATGNNTEADLIDQRIKRLDDNATLNRQAYQPTEDQLSVVRERLGGYRDPIWRLIQQGDLTFWYARPVFMLRSDLETQGVSLASAWRTEFVEGSPVSRDLHLYRDRAGERAWHAARKACTGRAWVPVSGLIAGTLTMKEATRRHRGNENTVRDILKEQLRKSLTAAGQSFGF